MWNSVGKSPGFSLAARMIDIESMQPRLLRNQPCRSPIASPTKPAPTCASTPTTPWTGIPGATKRCASADELDRPIFLSIGYSACHWCHVMEHESFEDPEIGSFLNEHFVSIKVDREERPDLDQIYMTAVQLMTRPRRLADVGVPDARPQAVLRRHLLPAGRSLRPAVVHAGTVSGCGCLAKSP